jgi:threonine dehydrogenase-like Zn-dependent dehydrogenase
MLEADSARMSNHAHAFWVVEPGRGEIRGETLPSPSGGDVVVRARYSGISRGTESLVFRGRVPVSEHRRMRAPFQAGEFPAPVKYGYSSVGIVENGPPELRDHDVFVLYPHQTRYVVPPEAVYLLPDSVPPERAVLAANLETAVNVLWDGRPQVGDRISVIGGGAVGCLIAWLAARLPASDVQLVDVNPVRAAVARSFGARFASPGGASHGADLVFHASGSSEGLELALQVAGFEATVVEASWYGDTQVPLPLGADFHSRRLTLKSSQVGHVASTQRARWNARRRMELALSLLSDPMLDQLVTGESDFETLPDMMARLAASPGDTICHRIRYGR